VSQQPASVSICPSGTAMFSLTATDPNPLIYQWQWQPAGPSTAWAALVNGVNNNTQGTPTFDVSGAATPSMSISSMSGLGGSFRCLITNACRSVTSNEATLTILGPSDPACTSCSPCAADYNSDGGVDGSDVDTFFIDWVQAATCADVNQDGGVDRSDVDTFFASWVAGGC